jgi:hypothetical protein
MHDSARFNADVALIGKQSVSWSTIFGSLKTGALNESPDHDFSWPLPIAEWDFDGIHPLIHQWKLESSCWQSSTSQHDENH